MIKNVYKLNGPITAYGTGEYNDSSEGCPLCGAVSYWQARNLIAELYTPADRNIWVTDDPFILIETTSLVQFSMNMEGLFYQPTTVLWSQNEPDQTLPLPSLLQIRSHFQIHLDPDLFTPKNCICGSGTQIKQPWRFLPPQQSSGEEGIWQVAEHSKRMVFTKGIRDALLKLQPDLEFTEHEVVGGNSGVAP